jgi:hypothetical protein
VSLEINLDGFIKSKSNNTHYILKKKSLISPILILDLFFSPDPIIYNKRLG